MLSGRFEFLSQCSYHFDLAYTRQYVIVIVRNTCTHTQQLGWNFFNAFTRVFCVSVEHFCIPAASYLLLFWEDDKGQLMKSRHLCTVQDRSAKNKLLASVHALLKQLDAAACESLWRLKELNYKRNSRCTSMKCSDVEVDCYGMCADRCMIRQLL